MKKINIYLLTTLIAMLYSMALQAQNHVSQLSGRVTTADGQAAPGISVTLKPGYKGTTTDSAGYYRLSHIKPGQYQLKISGVGIATQQKSISLAASQNMRLNFSVNQTQAALAEVSINAHKNKLRVSKANINDMDLPQATGTVSSQVLADQQITKLGDAVKNVSGVSLTQTRGGTSETLTARGYSIGIGGGSGSIFKNGVLTNTSAFPEAATLESVEVIKGTSALMYGNVSGGLIINLNTKRPQFTPGAQFTLQTGSYNSWKPIVDVYGPISKNVAARIITTYERADSYRDNVHTERYYVNPSVLYNIGKRTTLIVEGDFLRASLTPDFGVGIINGQQIPTDVSRSRFINTSWAYNQVKQYSGMVTLNHSFNDCWKLNAVVSGQSTQVNSYQASLPSTIATNGDWSRSLARAFTTENNATAQVNLNGCFKTAGIEHQFTTGIDAARVINLSHAYTLNGKAIGNYGYDVINLYNPTKYTERTDIPNPTDTAEIKAPVYRFGAFVQDLITLTRQVKVLAGVRWSWQETDQTTITDPRNNTITYGTAATRYDRAFSPRLALIWEPQANLSAYVNYASNFIVNTGTDVATQQAIAPSLVHQYETGLKSRWLQGRLQANVSLYAIVNDNLAVVSPVNYSGAANTDNTIKTLSGKTVSRGVEVDVNATLLPNLYFITGYAYNQMYYTQTSGLYGSNLEGEPVVINPAHTANASVFYTFNRGSLKGIKLGASGFYTGFRYAGYNNTVGQSQKYNRLIPVAGYATANLTAGYSYKKASILGSVSNITNTLSYLVHDNYSVTPIAPRQYTLTLSYRLGGK